MAWLLLILCIVNSSFIYLLVKRYSQMREFILKSKIENVKAILSNDNTAKTINETKGGAK